MDSDVFDRAAVAVAAQVPAGPRLAIVGSTTFWHPESDATCRAIGRLLAELDGLVLLTGGVEGVGEAVGRSFFVSRPRRDGHRGVFHLLPRGHRRWDYGETLVAGSDMDERREILGRLAECYVVVEGGPGTAHETFVALGRSTCVIPVGRSGGHAGELYRQACRPPAVGETEWRDLACADTSPDRVAKVVVGIVRTHLRECRHGV